MLTVRLTDGPTGDTYRDLPYNEVEAADHLMATGGWIVVCPNLRWIADAWKERPATGLWMRVIDHVPSAGEMVMQFATNGKSMRAPTWARISLPRLVPTAMTAAGD